MERGEERRRTRKSVGLLADRTQTGQLSRNRNQVEAKKSSPGGKSPLLACGVCGKALCREVVDFSLFRCIGWVELVNTPCFTLE